MLIDNKLGRRPMETMEGVEASKNPYQDKYVHFSHEMPDETAEASARTLIRTVPVIYGVLLGGVLSNMALGVSMGLALTVALDMRMGSHSLFLPLLGPLLRPFCPLIDGSAHGLAWAIRAVGLPAPGFLARMRCGVPRR